MNTVLIHETRLLAMRSPKGGLFGGDSLTPAEAQQVLALIRARGYAIANAPRPLSAQESDEIPLPWGFCWCGPFHCGVFYAAGPLADFEQDWSDSGATLLDVVDDAEVERRIVAAFEPGGKYARYGITLAEMRDQHGTDLARVMGYPGKEKGE